jgi:ATP-binding cassette subfamily F protein uup
MDEPNVLFLDEPTNDLDIETLTQLEDLLDGWPGSMIVVSHDRYFVERTTDTVQALLGDGRLRMLPGGIDEYLERRRRIAAQPAAPAASSTPSPAAAAKRPTGDTRAAKKELQRIERQLARLEEQEAKLHAELAANATDFSRVAELDTQLRTVRAEREELELAWLELAEQV